MLSPSEFVAPLGPLRRETFRDASESVFLARVGALLNKATATVGKKLPGVVTGELDADDAVEQLVLALAFEQAASIWAGLPEEESIGGDASYKYPSPDELRKESDRYAERYANLLEKYLRSPVLEPSTRRSGRLRRV